MAKPKKKEIKIDEDIQLIEADGVELTEAKVDPRNQLNQLPAKEWIPETISVWTQRGLGAGHPDAQIERPRLASKLTTVRTLQQNELAVQEQLENQRAAQNAEILRQYQYKAPQLEMPKRTPILTPTVLTNCQTYGGQVNCTSR